eukprot:6852232-Prymnesium_polylepis.1
MPSSWRMREMSSIAASEWPPLWKNWSCTPTSPGAAPSTPHHSSWMTSSKPVRGRTRTPFCAPPSKPSLRLRAGGSGSSL